MSATACPWCEAELIPEAIEINEQCCPECLTSWRFEEERVDLALAA